MKLYAIRDDNKRACAYLFCYPKSKEFVIELNNKADHWETPMLLSSFAKKGILSIDPYHSKMWIQQRIVPYERQNIGQILKDNGLKAYDELKLLELSDGRCAQDDYYIERLDPSDLPKSIKNRLGKRLSSCAALCSGQYLLTFQNGQVKRCDIVPIIQNYTELSAFIKARPDQLDKARIAAGGSVLGWDERLTIPCADLYDTGKNIPLSAEEITSVISQSVVDTAEACELLGCSRQYINELVSTGRLVPIKSNEKCTLFLKSDIYGKRSE